MKKNSVITGILVTVGIVLLILAVIWYVVRPTPVYIQGEVEVTSVKISSKAAGRIENLYVKEGQPVRAGQLLFEISTPEAEAKLRQATAARAAAAAQESKAYRGARPEEIEAAYNLWQTATASAELAAKTYRRVENLYESGVVPRQQLDEAEAAYKATQASARAAESQYRLAVDGARNEDKASAAALVDQASGVVDEVETVISDSHQYAPFAGEIGTLIAEQGELVGAGYPIITLLDFSDMWITFNIKEDLLPKIKMGTVLNAYVTALDLTVPLTVDYMAAQADYATWSATKTTGSFDVRTFEVRARPERPVEGLRPGMTVVVNWDEI